MVAGAVKGPILVIVGETASGKSALAFELAERFNGEIICADSRTVYRGMDIGTAKSTPEDRARVPHHCLNLVNPDQPFTAADFKKEAERAMADIAARGKLPILVGGTGLYVDAILYDYTFRAPADISVRSELAALSVPELQDRLKSLDIPLPNNPQNPRHLIRAIETGGALGVRKPLREDTLIIGIQLDRDELRARVEQRVETMIAAGLNVEAKKLSATYGWDISPMQTIGYQEWQIYFSGDQTPDALEHVKQLIVRNTLSYAKRQRTWFKRNKSIHWFDNRGDIAEIVALTTTLLNK